MTRTEAERAQAETLRRILHVRETAESKSHCRDMTRAILQEWPDHLRMIEEHFLRDMAEEDGA